MLNNVGEQLHGFTVTRIRESKELNGRLVEMTHDKTGAGLCWVDNGAINKLFSVAFKTIPSDSTGVFHILEHSVLCGSDKYPAKEPFANLMKASMNTFLNAMTFGDKTMYPVSSRNKQDFLNLTGVYLDAVFAPALRTNPNIFYQEGWHVEQAEDGTLSYKGVVFNEMKGATSGVERIIDEGITRLLFPDTCYSVNSGGDPEVIPDLTYEQFVATYERFYHPSNAYIFLDGDVPMDETLALIDSYLAKKERSTQLPALPKQTPVGGELTAEYDLAKEESLTDKGYIALGKIVCGYEERVRLIAAMALKDVLLGSNEAPLKRALLSAGAAQDVSSYIDDSIAQPYLVVTLKNVPDGREQEAVQLVNRTARELAQKGIDKNALRASLSRFEFSVREPEEPQGLDRAISSMTSWLYGGDPMQYLVYNDDFARVRACVETDYFDRLTEELFDQEAQVVFRAVPSYTAGEAKRAKENQRLEDLKNRWSEADAAANKALNENLLRWQQTPDSPEATATIPVLPVSEISETPMWTETEEQQCAGVPVLYHPVNTNGIVHFALFFDLSDFTAEEIGDLSRIGSFYGKLPTEQYDVLALQEAMKTITGRMNFGLEIHAAKGKTETASPKFVVEISVLPEYLDQAEDLLLEVLLRTKPDREKIREQLIQMNERAKQAGVTAGHLLAIAAANAHYSAAGVLNSMLAGYESIQRCHRLADHFEDEFDGLVRLYERFQTAIGSARMACSVTAGEPVSLERLINKLPRGTEAPREAAYTSSLPMSVGFPIPAQTGFSAQAYQLNRAGKAYRGSFRVAVNIASLDYLWNAVRVQGGAYGTGFGIRRDGTAFSYSYRDPSPEASLETNRGMGDFLRDFCKRGEPLDGYILTSIADFEPLRSPREEGIEADKRYYSGHTYEDECRIRKEILHASYKDILEVADFCDTFAKEGASAIAGFEDLLTAKDRQRMEL